MLKGTRFSFLEEKKIVIIIDLKNEITVVSTVIRTTDSWVMDRALMELPDLLMVGQNINVYQIRFSEKVRRSRLLIF